MTFPVAFILTLTALVALDLIIEDAVEWILARLDNRRARRVIR